MICSVPKLPRTNPLREAGQSGETASPLGNRVRWISGAAEWIGDPKARCSRYSPCGAGHCVDVQRRWCATRDPRQGLGDDATVVLPQVIPTPTHRNRVGLNGRLHLPLVSVSHRHLSFDHRGQRLGGNSIGQRPRVEVRMNGVNVFDPKAWLAYHRLGYLGIQPGGRAWRACGASVNWKRQ